MDLKNCSKCNSEVDGPDQYCRYCGQDLSGRVPWYYQPIWIAVLTVLAMGPFSLVLVWRSPALAGRGRWIFTVLILAFTVYLGIETVNLVRKVQEVFAPAG